MSKVIADERNVAAVENRAALSQPVMIRVPNDGTLDHVVAAFKGFADFCEGKGATTTAGELRAMAAAAQHDMSAEVVIRLNSTGMVIATGMALVGFAGFLNQMGNRKAAKTLADLYDQLIAHIPDDWDCGDPECEACARHHGRNVVALTRGDA